jgi:hypothetical protein
MVAFKRREPSVRSVKFGVTVRIRASSVFDGLWLTLSV